MLIYILVPAEYSISQLLRVSFSIFCRSIAYIYEAQLCLGVLYLKDTSKWVCWLVTLLCALEKMLESTYGSLNQILITKIMGSKQRKGFLNCSNCMWKFLYKRCLNFKLNPEFWRPRCLCLKMLIVWLRGAIVCHQHASWLCPIKLTVVSKQTQ